MIRHLPTVFALCALACTYAAIWNADEGNGAFAACWAWVAFVALLGIPFAVHITPGDSDE